MAQNIKGSFLTGAKKQLVGGILPSVLGLLLIFSLIFSYKLNNYRKEIQIYEQTKAFYIGKTIEQLTVGRLQQEHGQKGSDFQLKGKDRYDVGEVSFEIREQKISLRVTLKSGFTYIETTKLGTK